MFKWSLRHPVANRVFARKRGTAYRRKPESPGCGFITQSGPVLYRVINLKIEIVIRIFKVNLNFIN